MNVTDNVKLYIITTCLFLLEFDLAVFVLAYVFTFYFSLYFFR